MALEQRFNTTGRKTVVRAWHSALEPKFAYLFNAQMQSLVDRAAFTRFYAFGIAKLVFAKLAVLSDAQIMALSSHPTHPLMNETLCQQIVDGKFQTLIDKIIVMAYTHGRPCARVGAWISQCGQEYFGALGALPTIDAHPDQDNLVTFRSTTRAEMGSTMEIAITNCLENATPFNMVTFMKHVHRLTDKEARIAATHVGTSLAAKFKLAHDLQVKRAFAAMREAEHAHQHMPEDAAAELKATALTAYNFRLRELDRIKESTVTDIGIAQYEIRLAFPIIARIAHHECPDLQGLPTLAEIIDFEIIHLAIPAEQRAMDQLRLRQAMLERFPDGENVERFNLVPSCGVGTPFIRVTHHQLIAMIPGGLVTVRAWIAAKAEAAARDAEMHSSRVRDFDASAAAAYRRAVRGARRDPLLDAEAVESAGMWAATLAYNRARDKYLRDRDEAAALAEAMSWNEVAERAAPIAAAGKAAVEESYRQSQQACNAARDAAYAKALAEGGDVDAANWAGAMAHIEADKDSDDKAFRAGQAAAHQMAIDFCVAAILREANINVNADAAAAADAEAMAQQVDRSEHDAVAAAEHVEHATGVLTQATAYAASAAEVERRALDHLADARRSRGELIALDRDRCARMSARTFGLSERLVDAIGEMEGDTDTIQAARARAHAIVLRTQVQAQEADRAAADAYERATTKVDIARRIAEAATRFRSDADNLVMDAEAAVVAARADAARMAAIRDGAQAGSAYRAQRALIQVPIVPPADPLTRIDLTAGAMSMIFKSDVIQDIQSDNWLLGDSIMTDGVQLHQNVVTRGTKAAKTGRTAQTQKTKLDKKTDIENDPHMQELHAAMATFQAQQQDRRHRVSDQEYDLYMVLLEHMQTELEHELNHKFDQDLKVKRKADGAKKKANTPAKAPSLSKLEQFRAECLLHPAGARFIGIDPGKNNLCGVDRKWAAGDPEGMMYSWVYSLKSWRHDTGQLKRQRELEAALARARLNPDKSRSAFAIAEEAYNGASTKTADFAQLLAAVQTQALNFKAMHDFYGHPKRVRAKFANYIGEQRMMHTLVNRISPLETRALDVALIGDAINNRGSMRNSVSPKLVRALKKAGVRCVEVDEFRTSMLDSERHILMHHPPKRFHKPDINGRMAVRVFGDYNVYQASMPGFSRTRSRDKNAARNIREKYQYMVINDGKVPLHFCRSPAALPAICTDGVRQYTYRAKVDADGRQLPGFTRKLRNN